MRLKLFPFTLKDKAKIWLNSLRPRSIRIQILNSSAKENEKFYECWERYMEAINTCPHPSFDTWLLVSYFYDGMSSSMKQLLETMCGGDFMNVGRMKSQSNAKGGMYVLSEDMDMKVKFATMARRLEELELKKVQEVQAISETPVQAMPCSISNVVGQFKPNNNAPYGSTYNSNWRNHPNFSWKPRPPQYTPPAQAPQQASNLEQAIVNLSKVVGDFVGEQKSINSQLNQKIDRVESTLNKMMDGMQNDLSQKIDNVQYSISRLTNLNTVQEKGKFPSQPHQNPKGIHEVEAQEGESSKVREVKAIITLRSGKEVVQPTPKLKHDEGSELEKDMGEKKSKEDDHDSSVDKEPRIVIKEDMMKKHMPPPFSQALHRFNVTKKAFLTEQVSAIIQCKSLVKYKDPRCSTILVNIGGTCVEKALLDLGASVNLLPYSVDKFYYPVDFVFLNTDPVFTGTNYVPIILRRPFLATSNAIINCRNGVMQLMFGNMTLELNIFHLCKKHLHPEEEEGLEEVCMINTLEDILPLFNEEERLNPHMQEVVRAKILKLLQVGIIYPISIAYGLGSRWCKMIRRRCLHMPYDNPTLGVCRLQEIECGDKEGPCLLLTKCLKGSRHPFSVFGWLLWLLSNRD
ncbi:hypothetical protein AAG906_035599 [Vitis piasezkii]